MFNDIVWGSEDNERECEAYSTVVFVFAKRFQPGRSSFLGPGSERQSGIPLTKKHQEENGIESQN